MLLSVLLWVLAVLRVLGGVWRMLLRVLAVGRVLRWVLPMLGVCSVLRVLWVLTVLAVLGVLAVLVVGAAVLREVLCVGRAVAGMALGRVRQGHLATVGRVAVRVVVGLVVGQTVLSADGTTGRVLIGAGGVGLLGGV